ncbi:sulfatase-like hydrolase/transferase [Halomarina halobia]|uniref:Sulfatase-like hydrolase/transferase n=1 Tax=Halomarina halobia TaxID=3033386 RepID=A0ABD6AA82_9EURY|nr:sulfatase-like hydrolase/transferase [Halomarina sp. PSR21]
MRNVVLIVLDTVRKDVYDEYAPRLRTAADASFEQCRAASSWSAPSHASILTGKLPHQHGVHAEGFGSDFSFSRFDRDDLFLGELPEHATIGLSANPYVSSAFDFDVLFDEFHDFSIGSQAQPALFTEGLTVQEYVKRSDHPDAVRRYLGFLRACLGHDEPLKSLANGLWVKGGSAATRLPIPELVDDGARNIADTAVERAAAVDEPWFLFANFMDAHTPLRNLRQYDQSLHSVPNDWSSTEFSKWELNADGAATEEYTRNYRQLYAAAVDYLDRVASDLVGRLRRVTDRETTVVVISDHGHNLGYPADDGLFHHTRSTTEGVLHTPCDVINPPAGYPAAVTRYFSQLSLGDLLVGLARDEPFDEGLVDERIPAELIGVLGGGESSIWYQPEEDADFWNRMVRCVYDGEGTRKFQWDSLGASEEYELDPDRPSWQRRVATGVEIPAATKDLFDVELTEYKERAAATSREMDFDAAVEEQLDELGYL